MRTIALLLCCTLGTAAFAAVPVVESRGQPRNSGVAGSVNSLPSSTSQSERPGQSPTSSADVAAGPPADVAAGRPVDVPPGATDATATDVFASAAEPTGTADTARPLQPGPQSGGSLAYQVQVLQQELQQLRGMLEEQQQRIKRMETDQKARYADMDRRLASGGSAEGSTNAGAATPGGGASGGTDGRDGVAGVNASERAAYQAGVQLTREKRYEEAVETFTQQVTDFPDGAYSANAFYWLGESYLALPKPKLELARQSFAQVVNLYPDHPKMPDALYKLGVVYGKLGDRDAADRSMRRVRDDFPGTPAAGLAEAYLSSPN